MNSFNAVMTSYQRKGTLLGVLTALLICGCGSALNAAPTSTKSLTKTKQGSVLLKESGVAKLGEPFPFFSGWALTERGSKPLNLTRVLKRKKRGYVITVAALWCKPCIKGLKRINQARKELEAAGLDVIVIVADTSANAKALRDKTGVSWSSVVVDEFKSYASKLCPNPESEGSLNLPRSFVLTQAGVVKRIISEEGEDYIKQLLGAL